MHRVIALSQLRATLAAAYLAHVSTNPRLPRTIGAAKYYPLPRSRGLKSELARDPKVQAYPLQRRWAGESFSAHFDSGCSISFSSRRIIPANLNDAANARSESLWGRAG